MFAVSLCRLLRQGSGIALASGYQAFRARASETILKLPSLMSPTEAEKILDLASYSKRDINEVRVRRDEALRRQKDSWHYARQVPTMLAVRTSSGRSRQHSVCC